MEDMQLAHRLRAFRKLKNLTQQALAQKSGVSLTIIGSIKRGNRNPKPQTLVTLAQALGISLQELQNRHTYTKE